MHSHLEIIMPPTDDVHAQVERIMAPFDENGNDDDELLSQHAFWDFWVIGGRWAGSKLQASLDPDKLKSFYEELKKQKVTVSGLTAGKETLSPESQIPMVDELWREYFPESGAKVCPFFSHSNDQYSSESLLSGDVCRVSDIPSGLKCSHVIIARHGFREDKNKFEAGEMLQTTIWNGCTHQDTNFDGSVTSAIEWHKEKIKWLRQEWVEENGIKDDWLCVTVDYHS